VCGGLARIIYETRALRFALQVETALREAGASEEFVANMLKYGVRGHARASDGGSSVAVDAFARRHSPIAVRALASIRLAGD